jgi:predicted ATPase
MTSHHIRIKGLSVRETDKPIIFLAGAQGSEKSEMAKAIRDHFKIPFHGSVTSKVYAQSGRQPRETIPLMEHLEIQKDIYEEWIGMYNSVCDSGGVFDRSPIDIIAYTLGIVPQHVTVDEDRIAMDLIHDMLGVLKNGFQDTSVLWLDCRGYQNRVSFDRGKDKAISGGAHALKIGSIITALFAEAGLSPRKLYADKPIENRMEVVSVGMSMVTKPLFTGLA